MMVAAMNTALDSVFIFLAFGANPNLLDNRNRAALSYALMSDNLPTVYRLLPVTNNGVESAVVEFAKSSVPLIEEIKLFLKKHLHGNEIMVLIGLENSVKFGNYDMVQFLSEFFSSQHNRQFPRIRSKLPEILD